MQYVIQVKLGKTAATMQQMLWKIIRMQEENDLVHVEMA